MRWGDEIERKSDRSGETEREMKSRTRETERFIGERGNSTIQRSDLPVGELGHRWPELMTPVKPVAVEPDATCNPNGE
jgi:hypothetical protein